MKNKLSPVRNKFGEFISRWSDPDGRSFQLTSEKLNIELLSQISINIFNK